MNELEVLVRREAERLNVAIETTAGHADGFGMKAAPTLTASGTAENGVTVTLWNEGGGDVWLEIDGMATATWWRNGRKGATLAHVVVAIVEGRFTIDDDLITVTPRGSRALRLHDRM